VARACLPGGPGRSPWGDLAREGPSSGYPSAGCPWVHPERGALGGERPRGAPGSTPGYTQVITPRHEGGSAPARAGAQATGWHPRACTPRVAWEPLLLSSEAQLAPGGSPRDAQQHLGSKGSRACLVAQEASPGPQGPAQLQGIPAQGSGPGSGAYANPRKWLETGGHLAGSPRQARCGCAVHRQGTSAEAAGSGTGPAPARAGECPGERGCPPQDWGGVGRRGCAGGVTGGAPPSGAGPAYRGRGCPCARPRTGKCVPPRSPESNWGLWAWWEQEQQGVREGEKG